MATTALFAQDKLIYAMDPAEDIGRLAAAYKPLIDVISKEVGIPIEIRFTRDYSDLVDRFEAGTVDFSNIGANNYVNLKNRVPRAKYIATNMEADSTTGKPISHYTSVIVVKRDSKISTISDLKGKKFAFTDKDSGSGYIFPKAHLLKNGINPDKDFVKVFMLKKHDKIVEAVAQGSVDAGATYGGMDSSYNKKHNNALKTIATIGPIPLEPFVAGAHLSDEMVAKIRKALTGLKPGDKALEGFKKELDYDVVGFEVKDDKFYDIIRETQKLVGE